MFQGLLCLHVVFMAQTCKFDCVKCLCECSYTYNVSYSSVKSSLQPQISPSSTCIILPLPCGSNPFAQALSHVMSIFAHFFCNWFSQVAPSPRTVLRAVTCHKRGGGLGTVHGVLTTPFCSDSPYPPKPPHDSRCPAPWRLTAPRGPFPSPL